MTTLTESIARALDNAAAQGAVTHWHRTGDAARPWVVNHRGHCPPEGAHYTTPQAAAFCAGLAARDLARPDTPSSPRCVPCRNDAHVSCRSVECECRADDHPNRPSALDDVGPGRVAVSKGVTP